MLFSSCHLGTLHFWPEWRKLVYSKFRYRIVYFRGFYVHILILPEICDIFFEGSLELKVLLQVLGCRSAILLILMDQLLGLLLFQLLQEVLQIGLVFWLETWFWQLMIQVQKPWAYMMLQSGCSEFLTLPASKPVKTVLPFWINNIGCIKGMQYHGSATYYLKSHSLVMTYCNVQKEKTRHYCKVFLYVFCLFASPSCGLWIDMYQGAV